MHRSTTTRVEYADVVLFNRPPGSRLLLPSRDLNNRQRASVRHPGYYTLHIILLLARV